MPAKTSLEEYQRKRRFDKTSEPQGKPRTHSKARLAFVVQKHAASHLHYDFRLEWDGVLKSWAIPKGPSLNPKVKRLAAQVEDHPYEYKDFEGVIPRGEYGGGKVLVWDRGIWIPENDVAAGLKQGKLHFELRGKKLKGRWLLLKMRDKGKNWLLVKMQDAEASARIDIVKSMPQSVRSGKDIEEVDERRVWHGKKKAKASKPQARSKVLPNFLPPQLATLVESVPEGENWIHEVKFDGYRALARIDEGQVRIFTRNEKDWTHRFPEIAEALRKFPARSAWLDGEIVCRRKDGTSDFQALQNALNEGKSSNLRYHLFDFLHWNGEDLGALPLEQRRALLEEVFKHGKLPSRLLFSKEVVAKSGSIYQKACRSGWEGIVSKRRDLPYEPGRGVAWVKTKCHRRQEFIVVGFTEPQGKRNYFGSLLLAVREKGALNYVGLVGTGFTQSSLREISARLGKLRSSEATLALPRGVRLGKVHWVRPRLIAEVEFNEWTRDQRLRHPSFQGLREDKKAREVRREQPKSKETPRSNSSCRSSVILTHPEKILFPKVKVTKQDLADYYGLVASRILPHLKGRPLSLVRCPDGAGRACFYQKHVATSLLGKLKTVQIASKSGVGFYPVADDGDGLQSLVQMGALEIHPWGARADDLEHPDRVIFDLDPAPDVAWSRVVKTAQLLRLLLLELKLESFVKTTGGKGLHVVLPIARTQPWDVVRAWSRAVVGVLAQDSPKDYVLKSSKSARRGKIFLDYLRNERGATAVAPYSTRAKASANVAIPIFWEELESGVRSDQFTLKEVPRRLRQLREDPWKGFFQQRQSLNQSLRKPWLAVEI